MKIIFLVMLIFSIFVYADFSRDNVNNIVTDNTTKLQWQDDVNASILIKTWVEAINYCEALEVGGYNDWRLPNAIELYYIADRSKKNPAIDVLFQNVALSGYWSSTTVFSYEDLAWVTYFDYGNDSSETKYITRYLRCVRIGI